MKRLAKLLALIAVSMAVTSCGSGESEQAIVSTFAKWKSDGRYESSWEGCNNPFQSTSTQSEQERTKWRNFQVNLYNDREAAAYCLSQRFAYGYSVLIQEYGLYKVKREVVAGQIKFDDLILKYNLQTDESIHNFCLAYQARVKKAYEEGGYRDSDTQYWPGGWETDAGLYDWGFGPKADPSAFIRGCEFGISSQIPAAVLSLEAEIAVQKASDTKEEIAKRKEEEARKVLEQQNQRNDDINSPSISSGSSSKIGIPNFIGMNRQQVLRLISDSKLPIVAGFGIALGYESSIACRAANNEHVITQSPKPGTLVNYKSGASKLTVGLDFDC